MARRSEQLLTDISNEGIEVTQETILMVLPREMDVINLSVAPMQVADDCVSNKTSPVTINEEPLVVKQEITSFEDQHFTEESTMHKTILTVVPGVNDNVMDLALPPMQVAADNNCKLIETSEVTIKEEPLVVKQEITSFDDKHFTEESTMHETILTVVPWVNDNVLDLALPSMQVAADNNCELIQTSEVTIKEEPLVVKQENTITFEDQHLTEQSTMHKDNTMDDSENKQQPSFLKTNRDLNIYQCNECDEIFYCKNNLEKHLSQVHNEGKLNTINKSHSKWKREFQQFQPEKRRYTCNECNEKFIFVSSLTTHMRIHAGDKPYKCKQCDKGFSQNNNLTRHIMQIHIGDKPYKCKQCDKGFTYKSNLTTHMRIHTGDKPYKCKQCDKEFFQTNHLARHMRIHTGDKPYKCEQCDKGFSQEYNLIRHMTIHNGNKPFRCEQCDKGFTYKSNLTTHIQIHAEDKPYKCEQCDIGFSQKNHLTRHIMQIHNGDKPYKCEQCDKGFSHGYALQLHNMRIHCVENTYKCQQCDKEFTCKSNLTIHMRIHTGEKPYKCEQCDKRFSQKSNLIRHINDNTHWRKAIQMYLY